MGRVVVGENKDDVGARGGRFPGNSGECEKSHQDGKGEQELFHLSWLGWDGAGRDATGAGRGAPVLDLGSLASWPALCQG